MGKRKMTEADVARGKRLKDTIYERGFTQAAFARLVQMDQMAMWKLAHGRAVPRQDNLHAICRELRISPNWLLFGQGAKNMEWQELKETGSASPLPGQGTSRSERPAKIPEDVRVRLVKRGAVPEARAAKSSIPPAPKATSSRPPPPRRRSSELSDEQARRLAYAQGEAEPAEEEGRIELSPEEAMSFLMQAMAKGLSLSGGKIVLRQPPAQPARRGPRKS